MVHPLLRRAYEMLPEKGRESVKSALKPRVELRRVIAVLDQMPRAGIRLRNVRAGVSTAEPPSFDDRRLTERLLEAYRLADAEGQAKGASMWTDFFRELHGELHETFMRGDAAAAQAILRDPGKTNLFYGFDSLSRDLLRFASSERWREANALAIADSILRLAEMAGARRHPNAEALANGYGKPEEIDAGDWLEPIEAALGATLSFPTPFPDEHGLVTRRGVVSYRPVQAIYQAMRIRQMTAGIADPAVLEIGGGLGRTAFYARALGVSDYTIVDLPMTSLAQGSYLGRVLGEDEVALLGETDGEASRRVKLLSPAAFHAGSRRYDLIVNCDSLTEMSHEAAAAYVDAVLARADAFLSINHEFNPFTVRELLAERRLPGPVTRLPYFMRNGYVEEFAALR